MIDCGSCYISDTKKGSPSSELTLRELWKNFLEKNRIATKHSLAQNRAISNSTSVILVVFPHLLRKTGAMIYCYLQNETLLIICQYSKLILLFNLRFLYSNREVHIMTKIYKGNHHDCAFKGVFYCRIFFGESQAIFTIRAQFLVGHFHRTRNMPRDDHQSRTNYSVLFLFSNEKSQ